MVRQTALGITTSQFVSTTGNTVRQRKEIQKSVFSLRKPQPNNEYAYNYSEYIIRVFIYNMSIIDMIS